MSRPQAGDLVRKLVELDILEQRGQTVTYGREFWYKNYLALFLSRREEAAFK